MTCKLVDARCFATAFPRLAPAAAVTRLLSAFFVNLRGTSR